MKLKLLTLTCALGLLALGTSTYGAVPEACKSHCDTTKDGHTLFNCSKCKLQEKAKATASGGLSGGSSSTTSSGTSSKTPSNTIPKTSPGTPSGKVVESDTGVSDLTATLNTQGAPYLCSKGSLITRKVTLRSLSGTLCKNSVIAAFAKIHCVGKGDFDSSQCATKHMDAAIAGRDPQAILNEAAEKGSGAIKAFATRFKNANTTAE